MSDVPTINIRSSVVALGDEFRVNTTAAGIQIWPDSSGLVGGGSVVVWESAFEIFARRYAADGTPLNNEFRVNAVTQGYQSLPSVTGLGDGGFVVVWTDVFRSYDEAYGTVFAQRYDVNGVAVGGAVTVNSTPAGNDLYDAETDVTALANGGYVVTWHRYGDNQLDVRARVFDANGIPIGFDFDVNSTVAGTQEWPQIVGLGGGGFVVVWSSFQNGGVDAGVFAQRYSNNGTPLGTEFRISSGGGAQIAALEDGGFLVAWAASTPNGSNGLYAQRYAADGGAVGGAFLVHSKSGGYLADLTVEGLNDGSFVIAWKDINSGTMFARHYDANAVSVGGDFPISPVAHAELQSISALAYGGFTTFWHARGLDGSEDVYGRRHFTGFTATEQVESNLKSLLSIGDDTGTNVVTLKLSVDYGVFNVAAGSSGATVTGNGTATVTLTGTVDRINALLGSNATSHLGFVANSDTPPALATLTVTVIDADAQTVSRTIPIAIAAVDDGPVARNDALATGETTILQGNLFEDNGHGADADPDGGPPFVVASVNGVEANIGATITLASGARLLVFANGNFQYDPTGAFQRVPAAGSGAANLTATDSFTYTLVDGTSATVTLTVSGIDNDDVLIGTAGKDTLRGGIGADVLDGRTGADEMRGGVGNDRYIVDNAADVVIELANEGIDVIESSITRTLGANIERLTLTGSANLNGVGNELTNLLIGNSGNNTLNGLAGADEMRGGTGNDRYLVDDVGDVVIELDGQGSDTVESSVSFTLGTGLEALRLTGTIAIDGTGNGLANTLFGNSAANRLDGGAGADRLEGGKGDDIYYVDNAGDMVVEADGGGSDIVNSSVSFSLAGQYVEVVNLIGSAAINATGNGLGNRLVGNGANNVLYGMDGNDRLDGQGGNDTMRGGLGNDVFVVDSAGDTVQENNGEGLDTVEAWISYSLAGQYIESLKLMGTANINATGNGQTNELIGNAGNNVLNGQQGADILRGGGGNDRMIVDNAGDRVFENVNEGHDVVQSSVTFSIAGQYIEELWLTGSAAIDGEGNGLANVITGNSGANLLVGGGGNDSLHGGLGSDRLHGGAGQDGFWFDVDLNANNVDTIADFTVADDTIWLDRTVFTTLSADGALAAQAFVTGTAALDGDDRIVYDAATGNIWFDPDGAGGLAAGLFAVVTAGTALTAADFVAVP